MKVMQTEFEDLTFLYFKMKKLACFVFLGFYSTSEFSGQKGLSAI